MSFATGISRLATQAATLRASAFAGDLNSAGYNIQIDDRPVAIAFTRLETFIDMITHGRTVRCTAAISIPDSLGITPDETSRITHLPTGEQYEIVRTGMESATAAEKHYLLRRLEP